MNETEIPRPEDGNGNLQKGIMLGYYGFWTRLTYLSAAVAVLGMHFALSGDVRGALICLMVSGLCDAFDGKVASLKKRTLREKNYGIQIDSLSDIVAFGMFPAIIGYALIAGTESQIFRIIAILVFAAYVLAALIRLAYFNVMEGELVTKNERRKYFEGLPVTSVALIIPFVYSVCHVCGCYDSVFAQVYTALLAAIATAFVMRIKIPKPRKRGLVALCLAGVPTIVYIIFIRSS